MKTTVQSLWPADCIGENGAPDIEILREKLSRIGYQVQIVGTDQQKARPGHNAWEQLPHSFLLCNGVLGPGDVTFCYQQVPCVVDPRFKEQFEIANPSSWFETLLKVCVRLESIMIQHYFFSHECIIVDSGYCRPSIVTGN